MEQGCPHRSILPHIFPDCNSFAIKIEGKFCGVRGVCPGGGLPALSPVNPAFRFLFCPLSPRPPSPVGKGVTIGYFMQGAAPLASPGLNPGGTGSPCRCGKLNGGACPGVAGAAGVSGTRRGGVPALSPAYTATVVPGGGLACFVACLHCHCGARGGACLLCRLLTLPLEFFSAPYPPSPLPGGKGVTIGYFLQGASPLASPGLNPGGTGYPRPGGEDHLKRRRRLRRIVPSPPVPPLLGCRHCPWECISVVFAPSHKHPVAGYLYGGNCKCRKRFDAGVPGAVAPGEINL